MTESFGFPPRGGLQKCRGGSSGDCLNSTREETAQSDDQKDLSPTGLGAVEIVLRGGLRTTEVYKLRNS